MLPTMVPVRSTLDASQKQCVASRGPFGLWPARVKRGSWAMSAQLRLPPSADLLSTLETLTQPRQHRKGCERLEQGGDNKHQCQVGDDGAGQPVSKRGVRGPTI